MYYTKEEISECLDKRGAPIGALDGSDPELAQLETLEAANERLVYTLTKLITVMYDKQLLTKDEAVEIIYQYGKVRPSEDQG